MKMVKVSKFLITSASSRMMNIWSMSSSGLVSRNMADTESKLCDGGGVLTFGVCCRGTREEDAVELLLEEPELEEEPATDYLGSEPDLLEWLYWLEW